MENFIVSARKYRPSTFDTVVGQHAITNTLKNAIKNKHLAQAFLFCGPRGVGKTTCARILAKTINCFNITENTEACDKCESCISFNQSHSFNIHELDAASNNSVEDIRGLVEQVRYAPQVGKYSIYIIDEVHMLSTAAFNAFLKTLEEPPAHAIFILATTERHKIIPTILSRCQIFDFKRIQVEDIAKHLAWVAASENVETEDDALHIIAQKADGALRDALSMFDQIVSFAGSNLTYKAVIENLNILDYDYYFKINDAILEHDISTSLLLFNEIVNNGFDGHNFINGLGTHFRNLMVSRDPATLVLLETSNNIKLKYKVQAEKCTADFLLRALIIVNKCDINYKQSKNQRLQVEISLMQMCSIGGNKEIGETREATISLQKSPVAAISTPATNVNVVKEPEKAVAPSEPVKKMPMPTLTTSISNIGKKAPESEKSDIVEENKEIYLVKKATPFSEEELFKVWNEYANMMEAKGKSNFYSMLHSRNPVLKENFQIEMYLESSHQIEEINEEKTLFLQFLREKLNNSEIILDTKISKNEQIKDLKPFTPKEKFTRMAEINPNIKKLKDQLDLDIEY